jgi:hypothetical protein
MNVCLLLQAARELAFNVSQLYAAAANSSLVGFTTGRAGDALVVVASLRSALGRPVLVADNVRITVIGGLCCITMDPLQLSLCNMCGAWRVCLCN